jgi:hypothetical protein
MKYGLAILLLASCVGVAEAGPRCYLAKEIEADQAVQFQTELMVVSSTCRVTSYTDFTSRNRAAIVSYQSDLIEYFRRNGEHDATSAFETYLTHLANETSLRTGNEAPDALCAQSAKWLSAAKAVGPADFHQIAATRAADRSASYRRCDG